MDYEKNAKWFKALSDPKRLQILDLLSCGELCACDILEHFDFTQPTLSHHMKILVDAGLATSRKAGTWNHYSLNSDTFQGLVNLIQDAFLKPKEDCICAEKGVSGDKKTNEKA
ncbi:ArsR/SmtB family transcription factor [Listeria floridensis]|nr:metalloregulator ArsR/SmtB family transcription factor [Listeria floridensis]